MTFHIFFTNLSGQKSPMEQHKESKTGFRFLVDIAGYVKFCGGDLQIGGAVWRRGSDFFQ